MGFAFLVSISFCFQRRVGWAGKRQADREGNTKDNRLNLVD